MTLSFVFSLVPPFLVGFLIGTVAQLSWYGIKVLRAKRVNSK